MNPIRIAALYISPGHNFFGHHGKPPGKHPLLRSNAVRCVAGQGIVGDRFFNHSTGYKGQITFFESEIYQELCTSLGVEDRDAGAFRRNALTRGVQLNDLIGGEFEIQGLRFEGVAECSPCYWMDHSFAPGTEEALKGRGGLRARILTGGILRVDSPEMFKTRAA
jgi:MOSC domain-containing protein YiiM